MNISGCLKRQWVFFAVYWIQIYSVKFVNCVIWMFCLVCHSLRAARKSPTLCVRFPLVVPSVSDALPNTLSHACSFRISIYLWWTLSFYPSLSCWMPFTWNFISTDIVITTPMFLVSIAWCSFSSPLFLFSLGHFILFDLL